MGRPRRLEYRDGAALRRPRQAARQDRADALADCCVVCGGSMVFGKRSDVAKRLTALRLTEQFRPTEPPHVRSVRLTELGWLTLLTRAENEMRHLLPHDEERRL